MHVAVIGAGHFGGHLALKLYELGHHLTVVDNDKRKLDRLEGSAELLAVADVTERAALEDIGIGQVDAAAVSLGSNMAASILATLHLREMKVAKVVVKAVSLEHEKILKRLGASEIVFPEREAAFRLARSLGDPNLLDYLPLDPAFSVAEITPPKGFVGKTLMELNLRKKYSINVIAVREVKSRQLKVILEPDFTIKDSDILVVLGSNQSLEKLQEAK